MDYNQNPDKKKKTTEELIRPAILDLEERSEEETFLHAIAGDRTKPTYLAGKDAD
jgi:hypothetical protein